MKKVLTGIDSCVNTFAVRDETEVQWYTDSAASDHEIVVSCVYSMGSSIETFSPTQTKLNSFVYSRMRMKNLAILQVLPRHLMNQTTDQTNAFATSQSYGAKFLKMTGKAVTTPPGEQELSQYLRNAHEIEAHLTYYIFR